MAGSAPLDFTNVSPHLGASLDASLVQAISSAVDPTVTDDASKFYFVGHLWQNTVSGGWFKCDDNTTGAAVWSAFIVGGALDIPVLSKTAAYSVAAGDKGKLIDCAGTFTVTLLAAATAGDGFALAIKNSGTGVITVSVLAIDLQPEESIVITCNGSFYKIIADAGTSGITLATPINTTSGTSHDFTGIPAGTKRIKVMFHGVSSNGASQFIVQLGDSSGIWTSGYLSSGFSWTGGSGGASATIGLMAHGLTPLAATSYNGVMEIELFGSGNTWVSKCILCPTAGTSQMSFTTGTKTLPSTLNSLRLTTAGGTNVFDAGQVNISYE